MPPIYYSSFSNRIQKRFPFDLSLYLVANRPSFQDENLFFSKVMASVKGGVTCVQFRDHKSDFPTIVKTAARLKKMLNATPLFINTLKSFEVFQAINADGIFLEEKFSLYEARKLLGQKAIIGISAKTVEEILVANKSNEIDYLSIKIFPSKHCPINNTLWGLKGLQNVRRISHHRILAIGGLNLACAESIYRELYFDDGIAMRGGLMEEENPCITAKKIQVICQKIRGK